MTTQEFLDEVARHLRCDVRRAEGVVFVVFQELRRFLPPKEESDLLAQLPDALKRMWSDGVPESAGSRSQRKEFLGRIRLRAGLPDDGEAERAVRAVFRTLQVQLGSPSGEEGEAWDVFSVLPKEMKKLWLASAREPEPRSIT
jgi:uncharacterized protein (DUF2267 family)